METTVIKSQKTAQEIELEVLAYLNKTAKHLFITEDKYFFKVIPVKVKDKWYYITMKFNGAKSYTSISDIGKKIEWYGPNTKKVIKDDLFDGKKTSIPNFKLMKEKTVEIIKYVQSEYDGTNHDRVREGIGKILDGITPKE